MHLTQTILIPEQLSKHEDFPLRISQNNEKVYSHVEYVKLLVQNMYEIYHKMSKSVIKLSDQNQRKLIKQNDSTALSIINFIKGIEKVFLNIKQQICNNTVNMNKKNQKVSKTRKEIIHQKLTKIYNLFVVYFEKVNRYNNNYKTYEQKCEYFKDIQKDVVKFYSTKKNKSIFEDLVTKQSEIQEQLEETYSLKIELKSGLCQIRLSLKEFFEMLSNNAQDDKKLLLSVRKKLKQTKIFNETIIQEVNSEAEQSAMQSNDGKQISHHFNSTINHHKRQSSSGDEHYQNQRNERSSISYEQINKLGEQEHSLNKTGSHAMETQATFFSYTKNIPVNKDLKQLISNLQSQQYCMQVFSQFIQGFERQINQNGEVIDRLRNSQEFQKFIDKKFQINQLLTSDMVYNIQAIKNEIADIRQIIEGIKGLFAKKKLINQLKKYRAMKCEKFLSECAVLVDEEKHSTKEQKIAQVRLKYHQQKQKFAKSHFQLMRRFRQIVQNMFRQINQRFKFQRIPEIESKRVKNQFITKKYFSLLMLNFFINKEEPLKFQMNPHLKSYQKYLSDENLKKVGLSSGDGQMGQSGKKGWNCCGFLSSKKGQKNKYIDEFNCALMHEILIQGKLKIHPNYLKFVSSFNGKTLFGETNLRIPKWDIESIQKKSKLLSLVITIKTGRGQISFTSFLTDPYTKLLEIYENRQSIRKTKQSSQSPHRLSPPDYVVQTILSPRSYPTQKQKNQSQTFTINNNSLTLKNTKINSMSQLEEKFQSQIPEMIDKEKVVFQSLSTYLSDSKKQLSISVQYHLKSNLNKRYFFEIQLNDRNGQIQYKFVHQNSMEDKTIKQMLQKMTTAIINTNTELRTPKTPSNKRKSIESKKAQQYKKNQTQQKCGFFEKCPITKLFENSSCSFIERRQNNKFEFDKDPSFVYIKQPQVGNLGEPSFNYVPDLQIFKNMDSQRKQLFEQRRIINHDDNKSLAMSRKSNGYSRQISKQEIESYLSSIDESTIKKNLFSRKNLNNRTIRRQDIRRLRQNKDGKQITTQKGYFSVNMLVLFLIAILLMNVVVSIFR